MKKTAFLPVFALAPLFSSALYAADTPISRFDGLTPKQANILGTSFYAYKYQATGTNPPTCAICDNDANLVSDGAAKIVFSGVLNGGVAIGLNTGSENETVDFSECKDGLKYLYTGSNHNFKINESENALKQFTATAENIWEQAVISLTDLSTNKDKISKFAWEFQNYANNTAESGSLAIKDFVCANGVFGGIAPSPEKGTDYFVLEDFANVPSNGKSKMDNYYWYTYKVGSATTLSVNYAKDESSNKFAELSYTLGTTSGEAKTTAAIGVNPSNTATAYYDFSHCTGFSYKYKGVSHVLKSLLAGVTSDMGYDHIYKLDMPASENWKEQTVALVPQNWGQASWIPNAEKKPFDPSKILKFAWEVVDADASTGYLSIDDFSCLGLAIAPPTIALPSGSSSSSSGTNNSSSSTATGGSSSSAEAGNSFEYCIKDGSCLKGPYTINICMETIGGLPSNSCTTPIIVLPNLVYRNGLSAMQNAVNLQITGSAAIQVFDLKGNMLRSLKFAQGNYVVPLSDLPRGLYIVKASNASWKQTIKMTVR